jgi:hypothetical protein
MKTVLLVLWATLCVTRLQAQKKEVASREETIEYLNQKCREIVGHAKISISQKIFRDKKTITEGHFKQTASGVEVFISYKTPTYTFFTYTAFNPKHIVSVTNSSAETVAADSPVGTLEIKLIGKTAIFNNNGDSSTVDKLTINFLQTDPGNQSRIINALNHLKKLYQAEDAMFE